MLKAPPGPPTIYLGDILNLEKVGFRNLKVFVFFWHRWSSQRAWRYGNVLPSGYVCASRIIWPKQAQFSAPVFEVVQQLAQPGYSYSFLL